MDKKRDPRMVNHGMAHFTTIILYLLISPLTIISKHLFVTI